MKEARNRRKALEAQLNGDWSSHESLPVPELAERAASQETARRTRAAQGERRARSQDRCEDELKQKKEDREDAQTDRVAGRSYSAPRTMSRAWKLTS